LGRFGKGEPSSSGSTSLVPAITEIYGKIKSSSGPAPGAGPQGFDRSFP